MELEAINLTKSYYKKVVVKDLSLKMQSGETLGLLGPNGAGKTTFFYLIAGLIHPDSGDILIDGLNVTKDDISSRSAKGLSYLPQESSIFKSLTVKKNILASLEQRKDLNKELLVKELNQLIDKLNLSHIADNKGVTLSGGERRRVEIARCLASNPTYILLDEPLAGIDPKSVLDIARLIKNLKDRGIGLLITDHNARDTLDIVDRAYILNEGKILKEGIPSEIKADPRVRVAYLGENF